MNNQNESPFANPRFIASIIVVFLLLWGWQYYINKKYPQPLPKVTTQAGTAVPTIPATTAPEAASVASQKNETAIQTQGTNAAEKTYSYEDDKVKWVLSSHGMGLNSLELKTYTDIDKKPIVFGSLDKVFPTIIDNQIAIFELSKVSDVQYVGTATINGKNFKKTLNYNKETMSFDSEVEFDSAPISLAFTVSDHKHVPTSSNFLMPSFEKQDFLYKDAEKVKTEHISGLKDSESLNKAAANTPLASIGTQYFTQSYIDKSEVLPSIAMSVAGKVAKLDINYNLKDSKINKIKSIIYVGPKLPENLGRIDVLLPETMDYGMFGFIAKPLLLLMKFMFGIFGNWGLAIIALTIVMRFLMLPFNIVSFKSARAMQKIQPELQKVREKYKNDPMAVNRETMALMKQHNANPLSSCLPMLIQIPIFFALWKTIGSSIEIYQQPFFGWITDLSAHDHFFVLPVLMGITMYYQQKLTPTTMDPTQAKILNFMPILFTFFMLSLPSGLTLYNFISALFGVAQQYFLLKDNSNHATSKK
ncbi:membrane protein insertase YidC [bacterium]|nr:membrane protein insertase YidC [bacterium]